MEVYNEPWSSTFPSKFPFPTIVLQLVLISFLTFIAFFPYKYYHEFLIPTHDQIDNHSMSSLGKSSTKCCQVEKCSADLSDAKQYHRRHKVCELHAKALIVVVGGIRQRFCQQCSRFHELTEFDETKRSCRRRLAGHNERRRKNSTDSPYHAEGSSSATRKGTAPVAGSASATAAPMKEIACGQVQETGSYKQSQIMR